MGYSKWCVDKIDLAFIVFLLIISLAFVSFASEPSSIIDNATINSSGVISSASANYFKVYCFELEENSSYTIEINFNYSTDTELEVLYGYSDVVPSIGVSLSNSTTIRAFSGDIVSFDVSTGSGYFCICISPNRFSASDFSSDYVTITKRVGFDGAINTLAKNVGPVSLWEQFQLSLPFVLVVAFFGFGVFLIFGLIRKNSKGKMF